MVVELRKAWLPLICLCFFSHLCMGSFTFSLLKKGSITKTCGQATPWPSTHDFINCSVECLKESWCISILFHGKAIPSERCELVSSESPSVIDLDGLPGYDHFAISMVSCSNMGMSTPPGWRSGCPRLNFSLDSQLTGSALNVHFLSAGKLGQALNVPVPHSASDGYYNLGSFPETDYCFPDPARCPDGVTFAFWMKIPSFPATNEGYLTTRLEGGPGLMVYGKHDGLYFMYRRYADLKQAYVKINDATFHAEFDLTTWIHYTTTYRLT